MQMSQERNNKTRTHSSAKKISNVITTAFGQNGQHFFKNVVSFVHKFNSTDRVDIQQNLHILIAYYSTLFQEQGGISKWCRAMFVHGTQEGQSVSTFLSPLLMLPSKTNNLLSLQQVSETALKTRPPSHSLLINNRVQKQHH